MSDGIIQAIIGLFGTVLGAIIGALAQIEIAEIKSPKNKRKTIIDQIDGQTIIFACLTGALGLIFSLVFANSILFGIPRYSTPIIDLGSGWTVIDQRKLESGVEIIYRHYPTGNIRYKNVDPDDTLAKAFLVCGVFRTNIFNYFKPKDISSETTSYESIPLNISNGCYVEFTIWDTLGNLTGIRIEAEPTP